MNGLGWLGIVRLGLVQSGIGAVVVLMTATLNRVMVVEMALPASLPAALVAWHYLMQISRPGWGFGSDRGRSRARWIQFGMGLLALGAMVAADATVMMPQQRWLGIGLGLVAFSLIGCGVSAAGTSLLALMSSAVSPERRPAAAAITWVMMIFGIVLTAGFGGRLLDPFSPQRLVLVVSGVALTSFVVSLLAMRGIPDQIAEETKPRHDFFTSLRQLWREKLARDFTIFVFVSMLAYSAQELILEPYAGLVFGYSLGQSTQLAGLQHGGVLIGMVLVGLVGTLIKGDRTRFMKNCTLAGCIASGLALLGIGLAGLHAPHWPLAPMVLCLGLANGLFAVSAIGLMMSFAGANGEADKGLRVGVWGAAQAAAFGLGGFLGASGLDLMRHWLTGNDVSAFVSVFTAESAGFIVAASLVLRLSRSEATPDSSAGLLILDGGKPS